MKKSIPLFYPVHPESFDAIEVHPIMKVKGQPKTCEDEQAEFWSVYVRKTNGEVLCVADVASKEQAQTLANTVKIICNNWKK